MEGFWFVEQGDQHCSADLPLSTLDFEAKQAEIKRKLSLAKSAHQSCSEVMVSSLLGSLHRADGSSTYSSNGCTVIAVVNGPIEVQRRDELPEEAVVDVNVIPATRVGGGRIQRELAGSTV